MPPKPPSRPAPAMGVKDGVRQDVDAAKEGGYNPNGVGVAWTHKFLNLKPWHPMNFRNREKVYLAEQRQYEDEQRKERGRQEFQAEQEYLKTISMLSAEEQERYKQRQSVSWLYQKPPGFDAAKAHSQTNNNNADGGGGGSGGGNADSQQGQPSGAAAGFGGDAGNKANNDSRRKGGNYVAKVIGGVHAVVIQQRQKYELKQQHGAAPGLSPPRGGGDPLAENQRLVVGELDSDEEERAYRLAMMSEDEKQKIERERKKERRRRAREERERKEAAERQRLQEAKEFLRTAGIQVPDSSSSSDGSDDEHVSDEDNDGFSKQRRRRRREKKKRRKS